MSMNNRFNWNDGFVTAYGQHLVIDVDASASEENGPGAVQSFKDETDINNIMRHVGAGEAVTWLNEKAGTFADVTDMTFQECMDKVVRAQEAFDALPAKVRDRFSNDPERFLEFFQDPDNADEAVKLGLATAREKVGQSPVPPLPGGIEPMRTGGDALPSSRV